MLRVTFTDKAQQTDIQVLCESIVFTYFPPAYTCIWVYQVTNLKTGAVSTYKEDLQRPSVKFIQEQDVLKLIEEIDLSKTTTDRPPWD